MEAGNRQALILTMARETGRVTVADLVPQLGVAVETIRRDLNALAERGVVRRTHGGAVPVESAGYEASTQIRASSNTEEKRRVARAAVSLLHGAETVFLDEGFSTLLVAEELIGAGPLTVVTPSLPAAQLVAESSDTTVILLGGRVRGRTLGTVDQWATRMLADFVLDVAFLGANGISRDRGLTTPDPAVAAVKQEAVRRSRRRVLIATHTEFGVSSFCRFAGVDEMEAIVTGTELRASEAARFEALGPRVLRV